MITGWLVKPLVDMGMTWCASPAPIPDVCADWTRVSAKAHQRPGLGLVIPDLWQRMDGRRYDLRRWWRARSERDVIALVPGCALEWALHAIPADVIMLRRRVTLAGFEAGAALLMPEELAYLAAHLPPNTFTRWRMV